MAGLSTAPWGRRIPSTRLSPAVLPAGDTQAWPDPSPAHGEIAATR
jgi:hypothetical protein